MDYSKIKFRGNTNPVGDPNYIAGFLTYHKIASGEIAPAITHLFPEGGTLTISVVPESIEMSIGIQDMNGNDVFDGDIVEVDVRGTVHEPMSNKGWFRYRIMICESPDGIGVHWDPVGSTPAYDFIVVHYPPKRYNEGSNVRIVESKTMLV